jgi:hypothetical protein
MSIASRTLCSGAMLALAVSLSAASARAQEPARQPPPAAQPAADVEPEALAALKRMSAYLATLSNFEVRADTTRDLVTTDGVRVQIGGVSNYKVRRPNAFQIDVSTDMRDRRFYYDGKQFTVYSPKLGYYATAAAPPTILQTIAVLENRYGIELPLEDLFRWNDPTSGQAEELSSGFLVGTAMIDGVATDHFAFRGKNQRDWQIWIQQGAQPLPRKLVIVDRSDEARPAYVAQLSWNLNPVFAADAFTFRPGPGAKAIHIATLE